MHIRTMTTPDVPAGLRLNRLSGWNQTAADWHRFLNASPQGCFVAESDTAVCGTATTISYEHRFAWIGMVLVDSEHRGRGIGTQLLKKCVEHLEQHGIATQKLDATPQGQPIYAKMGFVTEYQIDRWVLKRPTAPAANSATSIAAPTPDELAQILSLDREIFGADRSPLLRSLHADSPDLTICIQEAATPAAYALGRRGLFADHLGPWMATTQSSAQQILREFLHRSSRETLLVDCPTANPFAPALLRSNGFAISRSLTRMFRGSNSHPGRPDSLCAILGPEFG